MGLVALASVAVAAVSLPRALRYGEQVEALSDLKRSETRYGYAADVTTGSVRALEAEAGRISIELQRMRAQAGKLGQVLERAEDELRREKRKLRKLGG